MTPTSSAHGTTAEIHGLKWQTVDMPNDMNFHVYGSLSVRRNDLTSAKWSDINGKLAALQESEEHQYVVYSDNAYLLVNYSHVRARHNHSPNTPREILENSAMSTCGETIEYVDYRNVLKNGSVPVAQICLTAMLLRNAHVCMNTCHTAESFLCLPPAFEECDS